MNHNGTKLKTIFSEQRFYLIQKKPINSNQTPPRNLMTPNAPQRTLSQKKSKILIKIFSEILCFRVLLAIFKIYFI
jgi:hypothetical protein